jgi:hypothetical protein
MTRIIKLSLIEYLNIKKSRYKPSSHLKTLNLEKVRDQWRWKCKSWRRTDRRTGLKDPLWRTGSLTTIEILKAGHVSKLIKSEKQKEIMFI